MRTAYGMQAATDETLSRQRALVGDRLFKFAMLRARARKLERFTLGVDTRPGTDMPKFMPHRALPIVRNGSPGSLCSDLGGSAARGIHTAY